MKKKILLLLTSFCLFMISGSKLLEWHIDNKKVAEINKTLQEQVEKTDSASNKQNTTLVNPPSNKKDSYWNYQDVPFLEIDFQELLRQNQDTVGWIQVIGTDIDYPIVQTTNNTYYLNHSFDHTKNSAGWIFSDFRNNLENLNANTIVYGHNRHDGSMLGTLKNVLEDSWYQDKKNHIIKLSTPKENTIWQIFSVYIIQKESYYITTHFSNNTFSSFIDTLLSRSKFQFDTEVNTNDKILTLSTCKNNFGKRIVVHAKLIKKETKN